MIEDVRHEKSLTFLLSSRHKDILKESKFTDHEIKTKQNLALEKLYKLKKKIKE